MTATTYDPALPLRAARARYFADNDFGEWLGSVSRLIDGLKTNDANSMMDGAARRMRAQRHPQLRLGSAASVCK